MFHPLSVFEREYLSRYDDVALVRRDQTPAVLFREKIYVVYPSPHTQDQLLTYSLAERSWDANTSIPMEVNHYDIAVFCNSLVLVGTQSQNRRFLFKTWVLQRDEWNANIIPVSPLPLGTFAELLSVAGNKHFLCVIYQLQRSTLRNSVMSDTEIICYHGNSGQWKQPCKGPPIVNRGGIKLALHGEHLYAMIYYSPSTRATFYKALIGNTAIEGDWVSLTITDSCYIGGDSKLTVVANNLIIAAHDGRKVKLYTPVEDVDHVSSIVDIDEFDFEFDPPLCGVFGFQNESFVIVGNEHSAGTNRTTVVQFKSKGMMIVVHATFVSTGVKLLPTGMLLISKCARMPV